MKIFKDLLEKKLVFFTELYLDVKMLVDEFRT